uniref:NAC transcription factor 9 n=1 Tax=Rheum palmatum TaxID=137221 RepID=A0AA50AHU0_RHEPA|nr:NAC transcription factor 9 [Rheum palmatum]
MPFEVPTVDFGEDWPPGFRFHPTDEELVLYYLKRKICRRKLKLDVIREVDVYKWDPEELPGLSILKTGDRQWFFFSPRDRKYPNGSRSNRATRHGYWKATGKDRTITCNSRTVGIKKTLVFYKGRAPSGDRTDWVMHEYILEESELRRCQEAQDYYVLYKVFKKSGAGPKNGEQYGAPFREEDWADDELTEPSNYNDQNKHVKQSNGMEDVCKEKPQVQFTWNDVEEFMKELVDEPALKGPHVDDFECAAPQVFGEGDQSTLTDTSFGKVVDADLCNMPSPYSQQNVGVTLEMALSSTSQAQRHDAYDVASTRVANLEQHVIEEDFLEMDDLLGPDITHDIGEVMPQCADGELTGGSLEWGDGLSELDLYYDAEMFLRELGPVNEATSAHSYLDLQASQMVHQDQLERRQPSYATNNVGTQQGTFDQTWHFPTSDEPNPEAMYFSNTGDECSENVTPNATGSNSHQNENQNGIGVGGDDKWYTSALWSFVDSIPTTPASASESALVNRAFERMSSFTRLRMNLKNTTDAAASAEAATNNWPKGGRMKGFFILSFMGALLAVLFVLIGTFGRIMMPREYVK